MIKFLDLQLAVGLFLTALSGGLTAADNSVGSPLLTVPDRFSDLAPRARWFTDYSPAPALEPEQEFGAHPHIVLQFSDQLVNRLGRRTIAKSISIDKQFNGLHVCGKAVFDGHIRYGLHESCNRIRGLIELDGNVQVCLTGHQGRVGFGIATTSAATSRKSVAVGVDGVQCDLAQSSVCTLLQGQSVVTERSGPMATVIRCAALRALVKRDHEIRQQISRGIAQAVSDELDQQATDELHQFEHAFLDAVNLVCERLGTHPTSVSCRSTHEFGQIELRLEAEHGWIATTPTVPSNLPFLAAVHIHQSAINRLAQRTLAGRTVTGLSEVLAALGIPLDQGPVTENFKVDLSTQNPVTINLDSNTPDQALLEMRVSGAAYELDNLKLVAMDILVRYWLEVGSREITLHRQGEAEVLPPQNGRSLRFIQQRNLLRERLKSILPKSQSIPLASLTSWNDKLSVVRVHQVNYQPGWLSIVVQ
ncbi:MAG: hypothetical protein KF752_06405 [Pirellulaceae bacterium]|nr:hypothetical protein [Pirellulaceae bacterium]